MNETTAGELEPKVRKFDMMPEGMGNGKEKDPGTARKEEKQDIPSQGPGKEDESASGTPVGEPAAQSWTPNVQDKSTTVSPAPGSPINGRKSAPDMLPPDTSTKERGLRRKSIRRSLNGSAILENQNLIRGPGFESIPKEHSSPSYTKANFRPNGFTEGRERSLVGGDINLKDTPSDLNDLGDWVAQLISKHSEKSLLSAIPEPKEDSSLQPGQDTEMTNALDNVEDVRMTRGKEKKRQQQLKGRQPADELSGKAVAGLGKPLQPRDAAPIERRLKDDLNDDLKQKLFGPSVKTDMSTSIIERNACGKLLFNTLIDMGDSANLNSAAALKSALEERKNDTPFFSALNVLASSPQVMAFVKFLFSKDDTSQWEASNADESRPSSTGVFTSGATTITVTSGLTSRAGTSISDAEGLFKATTNEKLVYNKKPETQKRSQEVIQALEAATTILVQIQQGEAGTGYIAPYASGSMIPSPIGQGLPTTYGSAYAPPYPDHPPYGMAYGPPVGANLNNYASPYANTVATHPGSYASPYFNPMNQPPANYASPYANPGVPNQTSGSGLVGNGENQANKHDGHETHHDDKEAHSQDVSGAVIEANKEIVGAVDQHNSNEKDDASKASDEAIGEGVSNEKEKVGNVVDLDETAVHDAKKQARSGDRDETSKDDDLMTAETDKQSIAPPAENHKLFTGERLGDFTSLENIDWLLTVGNGGEIPTPRKKARMSSPYRSSSSPADAKVQTEVSRIINEIMLFRDWCGYPGGTIKQFFYASSEGQRLAAELKRLMAVAKPVVNTIIPLAESQARLRFYQRLESHVTREKRDREIQESINRRYGTSVLMQQWRPPPVGVPVAGFPIPPPLPSNGPIQETFVRRGNVIAAPPGGRNKEEEKKAETYGYPPIPGSRPGGSQQGQKRKRVARH